MPAIYDNVAQSAFNDATLSFTASGTNRAVIVQVLGPAYATACSYGGTSMTAVAGEDAHAGVPSKFFWLAAPATGAQTITPTVAGGPYFIRAISGTNVDQANPLRSTTPAYIDTTGTAPSVAVTTVADDLTVDFLTFNLTSTVTVGAGQTQRAGAYDGSVDYGTYISSELATGVSTTMNWTLGTSRAHALSGFAFRDAGATATLTVTTQPSSATSGVAMSNVVITSSDTGFTGTVTAALQTGSGSLSGTTGVSASAGVATFSNLILTGTGAHTLRFTATGHSSVDTTTITVSGGGSVPFRPYYMTG